MSAIRPHTCAEPGPYDAHCTDRPGHNYSCYDAGEDVSWNERMGWLPPHACDDPGCPAGEGVALQLTTVEELLGTGDRPTAATGALEVTVPIPEAVWMNANHRPHWTKRNEKTQVLRMLAASEARKARLARKIPGKVHVTAFVTYPRAGKNDPNNAAPTTKALIDGLTDYGCWEDDDQDHVIGPDHRYAGVTKGRRTIRLVLTPQEVSF